MSAVKSAEVQRAGADSGESVPDNEDRQNDPGGWKCEFKDLMRAIAAGAIIGMPLLYTMEMWWHGSALSEWHILSLLAVIVALNFGFDLLSGFRDEYSVGAAINEAVTAVGVGIVFSTVVLGLIGEVSLGNSPIENIGKILIEASVVSVGVSFANSQVRKKSRTGEDENGEDKSGEDGDEAKATGGERRAQKEKQQEDDPEREQLFADLRDAGATLAGSTVFALNIAPTEEIIMIAARLDAWQQLALLSGSLLLCYIILFASGFEEHKVHVESTFQNPVVEVLMASAMSLIVAFFLLLLFGQRHTLSDPNLLVSAIIVLGMPAIVGGAAGRIIV